MYQGVKNFQRLQVNQAGARRNARTPLQQEYTIVAGTDEYGYVAYKIFATSEEEAQCRVETVEHKRRKLIDASRKDAQA